MNDDKLLILTVGLPRSGKSTWVDSAFPDKNCPIVSPDSIRLALHGQEFISEAEPFVWAIAKVMVRALFISGHSTVIIDATNTTRERRSFWRSKSWNRNYEIFDTPKEECIERARNGGKEFLVPIIERMAEGFEPIEDDELDII
jgi:predicted kinase